MNINTIHNEDCLKTMQEHIEPHSVDIVLTSPPYCTANRAGKKSKATLKTETHSNPKYYPTARYDIFTDNLSPEEYVDWTVKLFENFDKILKENGCVLYNISYSSTRRDMLFTTIAAIVERTEFSIMDMIVWKKKSALPNNTSSNKLTRIVEPVFVFARKSESDTFVCNKKVMSVRERTGQKMYENVFNFIEAANNDGSNSLNKATYSSELCEKLLGLYGREGMLVYDPFMGTGTTGVACKRLGMSYIGSELSEEQTKFAMERIENDDGKPRSYAVEERTEAKRTRRPCSKKETKPAETNAVVNATSSKYTQLEMFDENGEPNPEVFNKIQNAKKDAMVAENENENEKTMFSSRPMSAIEREICEEFDDVDTYTMKHANDDNKQFVVYSSAASANCPIDDDEFE